MSKQNHKMGSQLEQLLKKKTWMSIPKRITPKAIWKKSKYKSLKVDVTQNILEEKNMDVTAEGGDTQGVTPKAICVKRVNIDIL